MKIKPASTLLPLVTL
ncbi:hypothetical protein Ga0076813_11331, partial [endosymbiont of Ridgeia piscesae]